MQTMKVALAVLCVAALLVVGECTKTKVKKSSSKSPVQWKKEDPTDPKYMKLLKQALNESKCPHDVPCKQVDQIISVKHTDLIIDQKYDIQYTVKAVTGPFELYLCEIVFLVSDVQLLKIANLQCIPIFEPSALQMKTGKV